MKTWLWRATAVLAVALAALALLAMFGSPKAEPVGLKIAADCWHADEAYDRLSARGLLLRDAWLDGFGQAHERWVSADGGIYAEVIVAVGPAGEARCVIAATPPLPGDPS